MYAEHEPVSAIEIGRPPLRGYVVLIVEYLLAEHRRAVNAKSGRPETVLRCVNGSVTRCKPPGTESRGSIVY